MKKNKDWFSKKINRFGANKLYLMDDVELELEGRKWNIAGGISGGNFDRQFIIGELIKKSQANNSRIAIFISLVAVILSIASFILVLML